MQKSKLFDLLRSLDKAEFRRFKSFTASPYFNKNEDLTMVLCHVEHLAPNFDPHQLDRKKLFLALYPNESYDPQKITYLMSYLFRLGEQFLSIERYQKEEELVQCYALDQYVDKGLDKHYHYLFKKCKPRILENEPEDGSNFYHQYLFSKVSVDHFYSKRIRKFDPSLQMVSDHLDQFYFFHKLKYSCEMLNRQTILAAEYQPKFIDEVRGYLLKQSEINPLIETYLRIYLCLSKPEEEQHFEKLMGLIDQYAQCFKSNIRREIYLYALNYCAPKIRTGTEKYLPIMLDLYIQGIKNRALFDGQYLSHWTYANVVRLALRLQKYQWAEDFIKKNTTSLSPMMRADAKHYNLAELFYHAKDFDQSLYHLNQLQFTDLQYHLGSRVILVKLYMEQGNEEPLLSLLASFSVYLRRNKKISVQMKKTYLNFCNLLHQILRRNPMKWERLGEKIRETQPLAERAWLLKVWNEKA